MKRLALILALVAITPTPSFAMTAFLVSQRTGTSVTGMMINICVYNYAGHRFEEAFPMGEMRPLSVEVE